MPHLAPLPHGRSASAGENCVRHQDRIAALLMALLAALFGRRRTRTPDWHPAPDEYDWDSEAPHAYAYVEHCGWRRDCTSPILYVIGPGPNLGLRPHPRTQPVPRPRIARAPPRALHPVS
jgi:hypothetical protein